MVWLDGEAPGRDSVGALVRNGKMGEVLAALGSNFICGTHGQHGGAASTVLPLATTNFSGILSTPQQASTIPIQGLQKEV